MDTFSAIDPALMKSMNDAVAAAGSTLQREAAALRSECGWFGVGTGELTQLTAIGRWAEDQLPMLRRRQQLAAAMDARDGKVDKGMVRGVPDDFLTTGQAQQKGEQLATRMRQELQRDGKLSPQTLRDLRENGWDPAYARGLYDKLGAAGTANLSLALSNSDHYRDDPEELRTVLTGLGTGLATYSREVKLDQSWLDRFALAQGRDGIYRPDLLAPIIAGANGARFDKDFLKAVGDRMLEPRNSLENEWMLGDRSDNPYDQDHATQIYQAIADNKPAAGEFFQAHFDEIQNMSRYGGPGGAYPRAERDQALANLVHGATIGVREFNEPLAESNTAHLLHDNYKHKGQHVYPEMNRVYGQIVEAYWDDLVYSVTTPTPSKLALADGSGVAENWDGSKFWIDDVTGRRGIEVPDELWHAMLTESMRDPRNAGEIGLLFAKYHDTTNHETISKSFSDPNWNAYQRHNLGLMDSFYSGAFKEAFASVDGEVKKWVEDVNGAIDFALDNTVGLAAAQDPANPAAAFAGVAAGTASTLTTRLLKGILHVDENDAPEELRDRVKGLQDTEWDTSWQSRWQANAYEVYLAKKNGPPHPGEQHYLNDITVNGELFTGDPRRYITKPSENFLDENGLPPQNLSELSSEQLAAYNRWLQDPAIAAAAWEVYDAQGQGRTDGEPG
jgi:hypothetical protein